MRRPEDLTLRELRSIAELAQKWLFLEGQSRQGSGGTGPDIWNLDKEVDCSDFTMDMGELLGDLEMAPDDAEELERKAKHEDFAKFVDDLMKESQPGDVVLALTAPAKPADDGETMSAYDPADVIDGSMADAQAATDTNSTAEMGASDLEPRPLVAAPHPLAGEEIRRGDMVVLIDGRVRLHDRGEAVKRLLKEFALWSGGFEPEESSYEEREMFLCGRSLDHFLSVAMWPDRPDLHVEEGQ